MVKLVIYFCPDIETTAEVEVLDSFDLLRNILKKIALKMLRKKGFRCDGKDLRVDFAHTRPAEGSKPRDGGGRRGYDDRRGGGGYNDRRGGGYRGGNDRYGGGRDDRRGGYNDRRRDRSRSN